MQRYGHPQESSKFNRKNEQAGILALYPGKIKWYKRNT
jgi:hypothetical protein